VAITVDAPLVAGGVVFAARLLHLLLLTLPTCADTHWQSVSLLVCQFVSSSVCQFSASQPGNQQTNKLTLLEPKSVAAREGKEREAPGSKLFISLVSTKIVENKIYGCPKRNTLKENKLKTSC